MPTPTPSPARAAVVLPLSLHEILPNLLNIRDAKSSPVLAITGHDANPERLELARLIVKACNSHAALVAALEDVELRVSQATIACDLARPKNRVAFLLGELQRIQTAARQALAESA